MEGTFFRRFDPMFGGCDMWWLFTRKIQRHHEIAEDELVFRACYGLGPKTLQIANRTISYVSETWSVPESSDGLASAIDQNGVLALTDRRLCFFPKTFAIGTPKKLKADWPIEVIERMSYDDGQLKIEFADGSVAELHVPAAQSPKKLLDAFETVKRR